MRSGTPLPEEAIIFRESHDDMNVIASDGDLGSPNVFCVLDETTCRGNPPWEVWRPQWPAATLSHA